MRGTSKRLYRIGRRAVLAAAGSTLAFPVVVRAQRKGGVALVIGNSKYQWEASLPNVRRDAPDVARRFQELGLKTELIQDAGRDAMVRAVDAFKTGARGADLAAFYFGGHGANWDKDTYVVPIDADLSSPNSVGRLVGVSDIQQGMGAAAHQLMVFDNCRNNPADGWRQLQAQRAAVVNLEKQEVAGRSPPPNSLTLFSTSPGRIALDGPAGQNSPFAAALLRQLASPSIDLQALPAKLRRDLLIATQGKQVLWDVNSYLQPYVLGGAAGGAPSSASGWGSDPSRIIELPNVYAYARENKLPLPAGLIGHRPAAASKDSQKVGSFKFTATGPRGPYNGLMIVMSVEERQTAEIIIAGNTQGPFWRFVTANLSGDNLDYVPRDGGAHFIFSWSDANSGSLAQMTGVVNNPSGRLAAARNSRFARLDG